MTISRARMTLEFPKLEASVPPPPTSSPPNCCVRAPQVAPYIHPQSAALRFGGTKRRKNV